MLQVHFSPTGSMVAHGVTVAEYPGRRFSLWTDGDRNLTDAESGPGPNAFSAGIHRSVKPGSKQWRTLAYKAKQLYRIHEPRY